MDLKTLALDLSWKAHKFPLSHCPNRTYHCGDTRKTTWCSLVVVVDAVIMTFLLLLHVYKQFSGTLNARSEI
jgi:hypothetical protein